MIEHEGLVRELFDQGNGDREVPGEKQQVVGEIEFLQLGQATAEVRAQHEVVIGLVVDDVADADQLGVGRERF